MIVKNLSTLTTISPTLDGRFEVTGVYYETGDKARYAAFVADSNLLHAKLNDWLGGLSYYLRHTAPLTSPKTKALRTIRDQVVLHNNSLKPLRDAAAAGRLAWEEIQPLINLAKPDRENTQAFVNWTRIHHLVKLFVERYGPEEQHAAPGDTSKADEWNWQNLHR